MSIDRKYYAKSATNSTFVDSANDYGCPVSSSPMLEEQSEGKFTNVSWRVEERVSEINAVVDRLEYQISKLIGNTQDQEKSIGGVPRPTPDNLYQFMELTNDRLGDTFIRLKRLANSLSEFVQ